MSGETSSISTKSRFRQRLALALGMLACGAFFFACDQGAEDGGYDDGGVGGDNSVPGAGGTNVGPLPPEMELEENFRAPVVTGPFLWSANPDSGRVARIDARSLAVELFDGGHAPTFLAALPEGVTPGGALVLNEKSGDASLFLLEERDGESEVRVTTVPVQEGASAWAVGKGGRTAIAWSRSSDGLLDAADGYQDVTVMRFDGQVRVTPLAIGFRPSRVVISEDETRAYVVSDPGISVIALDEDEPRVIHDLFLPEAEAGLARDVSFTADGRRAFVRLEGESEILIVDTEEDERATVEFPEVVTDLDLSRTGGRGVAVLRAPGVPGGEGGAGGEETTTSHVAWFDVDEIVADPLAFEVRAVDDVVGSTEIADDGALAVLFTNALASSNLWIVSFEDDSLRRVDVRAPVRAALLAPGGDHAVTLQAPPAGSVKKGAFAVVPLRELRPARIEGTDAPPEFVSLASDGSAALVTTNGGPDGHSDAHLVTLPEFRVDRVALSRAPLSTGIVLEAKRAFVAETHPSGRISFIGLESASLVTVTGFELSSQVVDE